MYRDSEVDVNNIIIIIMHGRDYRSKWANTTKFFCEDMIKNCDSFNPVELYLINVLISDIIRSKCD